MLDFSVFLKSTPQFGLWIIPLSLVAGIVTSLTPCTYPVIPVFVSLITSLSKGRILRRMNLCFLYILGLSLCFSLLGLVSTILGRIFGFLFNYALTYIILGNILIILGLWNLGIINIKYKNINLQPGVSKWGFFLFGFLSGFFVSPCTTPVLASILIYISTKKSIFLGFFSLFFFGLGLGSPFFLLGVSSGLLSRIPSFGRWLKIIEKIIGISLIVVAEFFFVRAGALLCE